jgi:hypothetical protein
LRHLSPAQKGAIYSQLAPTNAAAPASAANAQAVVSAEVPLVLILGGLPPVPDSVTAEFPELKGLAFATLAGKAVLVDPTMRIVVDVAGQ